MALHYTFDSLTITDDNTPDREPLVLALPQDDAVIEAAILSYLGQSAPPPEPDWAGFRNAILTSDPLNDALLAQGSAPAPLLALPTALEAARAGDTRYLTTCLSRLLEMEIIPAEAGEVFIQAAQAANLPAEVVELLTGGEPTGEPAGEPSAN